jgi:hypothetical protein
MGLPFDDWQFYVVSLVVLAGAWLLVRPFLPRRRYTSLTVRGRRSDRKRTGRAGARNEP